MPSVQGLERVSSQGHFVPLLARTVGTRVTLRRRGDIRSLCLLDFPCLAARARHTVWCEPLTPSLRACTASQAARRALDPTRRATLADRRAARRLIMAKPAAKAKKDSKPKSKKPLKGFMLFSKEMRPKVKAEDPDLTFGGIGKRLGELWRGLSDAEKAKYNK